MKICMFSSKRYDQNFFSNAYEQNFSIKYVRPRLTVDTAILAEGHDVVCCFVNDDLNAEVITLLKQMNVQLIALRCAGFNNVDLHACKANNMKVCRVPAYSPFAVAEHACALILDLNRNIHRAHNRVRENDYSLDGLLGFDMYQKTVGVVGAGQIGKQFIKIVQRFGCNIVVSDPIYEPESSDAPPPVNFNELLRKSDIISLHCPLTTDTHHLIDSIAISKMKDGVMIINTSRGGLIDTAAVIKGLKTKKIGYLGIDVYEEESALFFEDHSDTFIPDNIFARLQTFPNVSITGHQGFFTREALTQIANTTLQNIKNFQCKDFENMHLVAVD